VPELAVIARVSKPTIHQEIHAGNLPAARVGRAFRIPVPAARAYLHATTRGSA
jgi:excisionase family DNA binding protein